MEGGFSGILKTSPAVDQYLNSMNVRPVKLLSCVAYTLANAAQCIAAGQIKLFYTRTVGIGPPTQVSDGMFASYHTATALSM